MLFQDRILTITLMQKALFSTAFALLTLFTAHSSSAQSKPVTGRFEVDSLLDAKHAFVNLRKCESERVGIARFPSSNWEHVHTVIRLLGDSAAKEFFTMMLADTNAAVRFYSAIGLRVLDPNRDWEQLIQTVSDANILFQNGCVMKLMSVREALRELAA